MTRNQIYIAGPFFNDEQNGRINRIETLLTQQNKLFHSPRQFARLDGKSTKSEMELAFKSNIWEMEENSQVILACLDDKDTGTIWEMGFAFHAGKEIIGFHENPKQKINLMLAESCMGFVRGWDALSSFISTCFYNPIGELLFDISKIEAWKSEVE